MSEGKSTEDQPPPKLPAGRGKLLAAVLLSLGILLSIAVFVSSGGDSFSAADWRDVPETRSPDAARSAAERLRGASRQDALTLLGPPETPDWLSYRLWGSCGPGVLGTEACYLRLRLEDDVIVGAEIVDTGPASRGPQCLYGCAAPD